MGNIEQLIYNKLSLQQGVNLPGFGSLRVESRAAKFVNKHDVQAPYAQVVFSKRNAPRLSNIVELMVSSSALTREECERQYQQWLELILDQQAIIIEGVGVIQSDFFTASPELDKMLNPFASEIVKTKGNKPKAAKKQKAVKEQKTPKRQKTTRPSSSSSKRMIYLGAGAFVLAAMTGLVATKVDFSRIAKSSNKASEVAMPKIAEPVAVDTLAMNKDSVMVEATKPTELVLSSTVLTTSKSFHVIAGMYSSDDNADKFIESMRGVLADSVIYEKITRTSGKVLVSIYGADSNEQALEASKIFDIPNLWVFARP